MSPLIITLRVRDKVYNKIWLPSARFPHHFMTLSHIQIIINIMSTMLMYRKVVLYINSYLKEEDFRPLESFSFVIWFFQESWTLHGYGDKVLI